jgi:predicted transcriptional regulator
MNLENNKIEEKMDFLLNLKRAPSQFLVFIHIFGKGKSMTVSDISNELDLTLKATERSVSKLVKKGIIKKSSFKKGAYTCDRNQIILGLILKVSELERKLGKLLKSN